MMLLEQKGRQIALIGGSGSGKSTVLKLLFRYYEVGSGSITINGVDIREFDVRSLRKHLSIIPQDTVLFNDTIAFNIGYGKPDSTREEIEAVARKAELHDVIMSWPKGYDTMVGERGLKISGGEKQRVSIARALLKDAPIILLDEGAFCLFILLLFALLTAFFSSRQQQARWMQTRNAEYCARLRRSLRIARLSSLRIG